MYLLKTGSPMHMRALRVFEPMMVATGVITFLATVPSIFKVYFTHSQYAPGLSLTTWSLYSAASLLWLVYGLLNRKPSIFIGNGAWARDQLVNGERDFDPRRMDFIEGTRRD
jgi:MtN3 and saliva related transmembrane protein